MAEVPMTEPVVHAVYQSKRRTAQGTPEYIDSVCQPDAPGLWWDERTNRPITCPDCLRVMAERGIHP